MMALVTDAPSDHTAYQKMIVLGTMGVMAACAAEFPLRQSRISWSGSRVATDWMPFLDAFQFGMTACAELIDWFVELKPVVCGMGIVAGCAAKAIHDPVNLHSF